MKTCSPRPDWPRFSRSLRKLSAVVFWGLLSAWSYAEKPRLNVLFIAVDDLRPELACYGQPQMKTPNLDRLAARGTVFERAYCQVAVCNPSRVSLLSGRRPDTTKVYDNKTFLRTNLPEVITLPQHFKNHGWHSLSLGKIFHHSEREPGDDPKSWSEPSWYHGKPYRHWFTKESEQVIQQQSEEVARQAISAAGTKPVKIANLVRGLPAEAANEPDEVYPDGVTATKAIETLQRLKDQPFFLGVGFVKPHLPFTCPQKYWDLYPADTIKLPENYQLPQGAPAPAGHDWYELRTYGGIPKTGPISEEQALKLIRGYRACVSYLDAQVGRVLDELDRLGLAERTVVVFFGDHGYHLGENGLFTKMTNFELGTRVPLIVSAPGQKGGQRSSALVELVDLFPTLAELCGLERVDGLEGTSFVPLLADPTQAWKTAAFSQYLRPGKPPITGRSIRTERWRYTEWRSPKNELVGTELYDHEADAAENINRASEPAFKETVAGLATRLREGWSKARLAP